MVTLTGARVMVSRRTGPNGCAAAVVPSLRVCQLPAGRATTWQVCSGL